MPCVRQTPPSCVISSESAHEINTLQESGRWSQEPPMMLKSKSRDRLPLNCFGLV